MREIKFRAWCKEDNFMLNNSEIWANYLSNIHKFKHNMQDSRGPFIEESYIFMQYTGLKDKNGKEIYEGDIILGAFEYLGKRAKNLKHYIVEYGYIGFDPFVNLNDAYSNDSAENTEVIGNIYENPDLISSP